MAKHKVKGRDGKVIEVDGTLSKGWVTYKDDEGTRKARIAKDEPAKAAKGKAKAKSAKGKRRSAGNEEEEASRKIGQSPVRQFAEYERVTLSDGRVTFDSGDKVAKELRGLDISDVYKETARALKAAKLEEGTIASITESLEARYSHLNLGMQRMNLGNRIRGALAAQ
jgi:hypothetical protein